MKWNCMHYLFLICDVVVVIYGLPQKKEKKNCKSGGWVKSNFWIHTFFFVQSKKKFTISNCMCVKAPHMVFFPHKMAGCGHHMRVVSCCCTKERCGHDCCDMYNCRTVIRNCFFYLQEPELSSLYRFSDDNESMQWKFIIIFYFYWFTVQTIVQIFTKIQERLSNLTHKKDSVSIRSNIQLYTTEDVITQSSQFKNKKGNSNNHKQKKNE
jgi:hypothetical protein